MAIHDLAGSTTMVGNSSAEVTSLSGTVVVSELWTPSMLMLCTPAKMFSELAKIWRLCILQTKLHDVE